MFRCRHQRRAAAYVRPFVQRNSQRVLPETRTTAGQRGHRVLVSVCGHRIRNAHLLHLTGEFMSVLFPLGLLLRSVHKCESLFLREKVFFGSLNANTVKTAYPACLSFFLWRLFTPKCDNVSPVITRPYHGVWIRKSSRAKSNGDVTRFCPYWRFIVFELCKQRGTYKAGIPLILRPPLLYTEFLLG